MQEYHIIVFTTRGVIPINVSAINPAGAMQTAWNLLDPEDKEIITKIVINPGDT